MILSIEGRRRFHEVIHLELFTRKSNAIAHSNAIDFTKIDPTIPAEFEHEMS